MSLIGPVEAVATVQPPCSRRGAKIAALPRPGALSPRRDLSVTSETPLGYEEHSLPDSFRLSTGEGAIRRHLLLIVVALSCASTVLGGVHNGTADLRGTVTAGGRALADVAIWLDAPDDPASPPSKAAVLDQRNLAFAPHVLVVRVGTTVELPNNDRVFHNVFSFHDGTKFDLGLYPVGTRRRVRFDKPGLSRVFCNIHQNMAAYVVAVDSQYFAVSDREGRFTIHAVRQGTYTYHAWRAGKEALSGSATVGTQTELNIEWR